MNNDVVIYQSSDGLVKMEAIVDASNETIWATQKAMAELFGVNTQAITKHLGNDACTLADAVAADVNGDEKVDINDVVEIIKGKF